jgi:PAS domain S-box-containing protein
MSSSPQPYPRSRSGLERLALTFVGLLVGGAALTLAGWWFHLEELLQPFGTPPAMKLNAALGFLALGAALLGLEAGKRGWGLLATIPFAAGVLTLVEHLGHRDLGIDELLAGDWLYTHPEYPGRMTALVAAGLAGASGVVLWRTFGRTGQLRTFVEGTVGSLVAAAGFATLLGYGVELRSVYMWGGELATPPSAAISLLFLGLALILLAWHETTEGRGGAAWWAPLPAVMACLTLTVVLWIGLRTREQSYITQTALTRADQFAAQSRDLLERQENQLERLARAWADRPEDPQQWETDAARQLAQDFAGFGGLSIAFLDPAGRTRWIHPAAVPSAIGFEHLGVAERRLALGQAAANHGRPAAAMSVVVLGPRGPETGFALYAPVIRGGVVTGFLAAEFSYEAFFRTLANGRAKVTERYHLLVSIGGETLFTTSPGAMMEAPPTAQRGYTLADRRMRVSLTPSAAALAEERRYLPELALAAGLGISALLGLSIHLARSARAGQRAAETSNQRLFAENDERRSVEARLKISDERLRLALDSTQIGIFEWNVIAGNIYYSPGLWAMFGYEPARMPSTVEAWQQLVHPDDVPLFRRRTESQLTGSASFIDPEYRVRAQNGAWRWVYTRAKSVSLHADGRPTRIIGTVQDITARRDAEQALRESQAEARKLSLVASKTDNPVLIGSPDGKIEWVNEAFCRAMEYSLAEIAGKDPAHFLVGPETSLRTVARIRTALARGQSISTDIVGYSKSGRKYHLQFEIQPVHGMSGKIENFIAVATDITSRVDTEQQLRRAKTEADNASRAKSEFLASMSHEIRTPMNGVIGMTSLLMETPLNDEQRDFVNTIRTSGDALLTIINDILDFSKIESGKMELERSPFELSLCLEEALDLFALQASAKKLELGYHMEADVPLWIVGDVTRLRQVVVNLINNAVKFTPSGSISVHVRRVVREAEFDVNAASFADTQLTLEFTVRDTGIGIPPNRIGRLFRAFSQVDSSTTRKYGGTGLGLAISQRLCALMGGAICVESQPGQGTAFTFTIRTETAPGVSDSGFSTTPRALRDGLVLCVEDNPTTQARLRGIFSTWEVECVIVPTPSAALAALSTLSRPPSLLVVDAGEFGGPSPLALLTSIRCPRFLLHPFGQTSPGPWSDGLPFASTTKPLRTSSVVLGIIGLFQSVDLGSDSRPPMVERPVAEEIPLEVLLAEDNTVNQKVALRFLERLGYRADAVANGLEAVTTLERRRYDLVLMDLQMPEMDGFEATRQIRARLAANRQPKIIALTANAMHGDRELCLSAGMDDYITKPMKMHEIAAAIRRHFAKPVEEPSAGSIS